MPLKSAPSPERSTPQIGSRSAAAAWLLGTALLAAGAVAVFRTANAAGCVALIAAGAAFILTAAWRHLPSSIKAGGYEMIWTTAYESGRQQVVQDLSKSAESGEDIKLELARLERETRIAETDQRLQLLKLLVENGFVDNSDVDILIRQLGGGKDIEPPGRRR
jgi:hypothetical protein